MPSLKVDERFNKQNIENSLKSAIYIYLNYWCQGWLVSLKIRIEYFFGFFPTCAQYQYLGCSHPKIEYIILIKNKLLLFQFSAMHIVLLCLEILLLVSWKLKGHLNIQHMQGLSRPICLFWLGKPSGVPHYICLSCMRSLMQSCRSKKWHIAPPLEQTNLAAFALRNAEASLFCWPNGCWRWPEQRLDLQWPSC